MTVHTESTLDEPASFELILRLFVFSLADNWVNLHPGDLDLLTSFGAAVQQMVHEEELLSSPVGGGDSGADRKHSDD